MSFLPFALGFGALTSRAFHSYKKTIATDGIAGLYRGFLPSVVGIVVYRGLCALAFVPSLSVRIGSNHVI